MWIPWRNLPYYTAERNRGKARSKKALAQRAVRHARKLCGAFLPSRWRVEADWNRSGLHEERSIEPLSEQLVSFLELPRSESRRALEELMLGYWTEGFPLRSTVERAYMDYQTMSRSSVPISIMDVLAFGAFFWNFGRGERAEHLAFAGEALGQESDYVEILRGDRSIQEIRMDWGVVRGFEAGEELKRMAMLNTRLSQRLSRELLGEEGIGDSSRYKNISSFQRTTMVVARAAEEIGTNEEDALELNDFFEEMWEDVDEDIRDYRYLEADEVSPEDLKAETQKTQDQETENGPDMPSDDADAPPEREPNEPDDDTRAY
jgi:hypothetical protein